MKKNIVGFFKNNKLLTGLYFVFLFLLCTTTYVGFSGNVEGNAVKVSSITPEYDEASSVVVNNNDVVFNDKNQEVKYKVVLENTESSDLYVSNINQTIPTESFLSYTIENLKKDDAIKGNGKKEIIVSLKTNAIEGWGRNFDDELTANVSFAKKVVSNNQNVGSPDTGDGIVLAVLIAVTSATGLVILIISKKKFVKYMVLTLMLSPALTLVNADTTIQLPITIKASFESQNVMKPSGWDVDPSTMTINRYGDDFWQYSAQIRNIYIENELKLVENFVHKFDVTEAQNSRVIAYLVESEEESTCYDFENDEVDCYDLHLQADGVIYPNENMDCYFALMTNMEKLENIKGLDTSNVTSMYGTFGYAGTISDDFTLDLSSFNTSKVTNMSYMFLATGFSSNSFNLDLSSFDTNNVTDMSNMFNRTGISSESLNINLSSFNTSNVTNMSYMFFETGADSEMFSLDISSFDTSNVTDMSYMFTMVGEESATFTLNLGDKFDTTSVIDMSAMFSCAGQSSGILNIEITIKNPNVVAFDYMFECTAYGPTSKIIVNYTSETEELVEQMIATKDPVSKVQKGNLIIDADNLSIGDEIHISGEKFNVISQTDDTVSMLAKYNLGTNYKQSATQNSMPLSEDFIWRSDSNEIDIQSLTSGLKTYVNNYVAYLNDVLGVEDIIGNLISLNELNNLECDVNIEEPIDVNNCINSQHSGWLVNGQYWYTRTGYPEMYDKVFHFAVDGYVNAISTDNPSGVRPVITISKDTLRNLGK